MMNTYLRYATLALITFSPLLMRGMSPDTASSKVPVRFCCSSPCSFDKSLAQLARPNAPSEDQIAYANGRSLLAMLKQLYTARVINNQLVQKPNTNKAIFRQFQEEFAYCQAKISNFLKAQELIDFSVCDSDGKTILILAAMTNQHSLISDVLNDKLVNINETDKQGYTALLRAIESGCVASVRLLLDYQAVFPVISTDCDFSHERFADSIKAIHVDFIAWADTSSERAINKKFIEKMLRDEYARLKN
ncbi:MAG: ankyrin repeat domain-containing protein [Candidatus Babeliales bacterium]